MISDLLTERVRQAIRYAINNDEIVETMLYGAGEPGLLHHTAECIRLF